MHYPANSLVLNLCNFRLSPRLNRACSFEENSQRVNQHVDDFTLSGAASSSFLRIFILFSTLLLVLEICPSARSIDISHHYGWILLVLHPAATPRLNQPDYFQNESDTDSLLLSATSIKGQLGTTSGPHSVDIVLSSCVTGIIQSMKSTSVCSMCSLKNSILVSLWRCEEEGDNCRYLSKRGGRHTAGVWLFWCSFGTRDVRLELFVIWRVVILDHPIWQHCVGF